ncbi:hypothetical protein O7602_26700 [Micromonospora sp. WMMD1128]|uniref:hypothetical protein n=1 Tax=Micromonospora sp. WMMD1128 TaxID=3015150 RepID=UPI00248B396B|nr:hypothetical protein [Micromonospora sp. WMMD1128]WBB73234.1 hypothetical protein O7602_26700 [Micromonospora sp. WMMD1128]
MVMDAAVTVVAALVTEVAVSSAIRRTPFCLIGYPPPGRGIWRAADTVRGMAAEDTSRDELVAAYADGTPIEELEQRYGLARADIERLIADEVRTPEPPARRAPAAIVAAALLVAGAGLAAALRLTDLMDGWVLAVAAVIALGLYALIAYGLWRGHRVAQILAVLGGAGAVLGGLNGQMLSLAVGAAVIALVLVPESARDWFARH